VRQATSEFPYLGLTVVCGCYESASVAIGQPACMILFITCCCILALVLLIGPAGLNPFLAFLLVAYSA